MSELKPCPFCGGEAKFVHIFENPEKCMVSCRECDGGIDAVFANEEAAAEAWNRRAQPSNEPLTLEELREMDGEPVWVVPNRGIAKWYLVDVANECCSTCDMDVVDFELYGPKNTSYGWLAYRRKPEPEGKIEK